MTREEKWRVEGFSVIPLQDGEKKPDIKSYKTEDFNYFDSTSQNCGILTGNTNYLDDSYLVVIDFDNKDDFEIKYKQKFIDSGLSETKIVQTAKGYHLYYKMDFPIRKKIKPNGSTFDIISQAYVVAEGSLVINKETGEEHEYLSNGNNVKHLDSDSVKLLEEILDYKFEVDIERTLPKLARRLLNEEWFDKSVFKSTSEKEFTIVLSLCRAGFSREKAETILMNSKYASTSKTVRRKLTDKDSNYFGVLWKKAKKIINNESLSDRQNVYNEFIKIFDKTTNPTEKTLLYFIAEIFKERGLVRRMKDDYLSLLSISYEELAMRSGISYPSVKKYMNLFINNNILKVEKTHTFTQATVYELVTPKVDLNNFVDFETPDSILPDTFRKSGTKTLKFIYPHLLSGKKSVPELSKLTNMNRGTIYSLLSRLIEHGIVIRSGRYFELAITDLNKIASIFNLTGKASKAFIMYQIKRVSRVTRYNIINRVSKRDLWNWVFGGNTEVSRPKFSSKESSIIDYLLRLKEVYLEKFKAKWPEMVFCN